MTLFRQSKNPLAVGQLRSKSWATLEAGIAPDDQRWGARCKQYWELQERLFGWRASDYGMLVDNETGHVSTYAVVLEILPGERTLDYSRVPVEAANVGRLTQ